MICYYSYHLCLDGILLGDNVLQCNEIVRGRQARTDAKLFNLVILPIQLIDLFILVCLFFKHYFGDEAERIELKKIQSFCFLSWCLFIQDTNVGTRCYSNGHKMH